MQKNWLRAVIFDLDGVLCDTDEFHFRSWQEAVEPYSIPFSRAINDRLRGLNRRASLEVILGARDLTEEIKASILEDKNARYLALISEMGPDHLLPGVAPLLKELQAQRIQVGVASASQHVDRVLEKLGIAPFVRAVCSGSRLARTKPYPDPYLLTASLLQVSPDCCLVIEDSEAGVQAGVSAGMCVLGVGPVEILQGAFSVSKTLTGITLKKLRAIHKDWLAAHSSIRMDNFPLYPAEDREDAISG
jgi:beta-phosphoglucomutase